jgi:hypothetical protein
MITDDAGVFVFDAVPAGRYELAAAKETYLTMSYGATRPGGRGRTLVVTAGEDTRVDLRLSRGGVIAGTVLDIDGQPAQGVAVLALARRTVFGRVEYRDSGSPALPTDDRGAYRIYGLPPGEYFVSAQPHGRKIGFPAGESVRRMVRGAPSERTLAIAQTFYPATADIAQAARIAVRAGEERSGVDIQLQYVPLATISGTVRADAGWFPAQVKIVRMDDAASSAASLGTVADAEGRFAFRGIPPGQYRVIARTRREGTPVQISITSSGSASSYAPVQAAGSVDLSVAGDDVTELAIPLQPSLTVSGRVVFEGTRPVVPLTNVQIAEPATLAMALVDQRFPSLRIGSDDTYRLDMIEPGAYRFDANPVSSGRQGGAWVTSILAAGTDVLGASVEIRQDLENVVVTISDRVSEVSGVVRDAAGHAIQDATVVAFTIDRTAWFYRSRRIAAERSRSDGRYVIRNLPPGEYRLAAATDLEPGEWFDPTVLERLSAAATPLTITGIAQHTADLTIR